MNVTEPLTRKQFGYWFLVGLVFGAGFAIAQVLVTYVLRELTVALDTTSILFEVILVNVALVAALCFVIWKVSQIRR